MTPQEFKAWRKSRKMTQEDVAKHMGVSRQTVINWEKGRFALPADAVAKTGFAETSQAQEKANEPLWVDNAPQCFTDLHMPKRLGVCVRRNLAHPQWFLDVTSPFRALHPHIQNWPAPKLGDLDGYVPPTREQAIAQLVANGVKHEDAVGFIRHIAPGDEPKLSDSFPPEWKA